MVLKWSDLHIPWQACLQEMWEAYCSGTVPIGAVVVSGDVIVGRGRNRIRNTSAPENQIYGSDLAHAEINALYSLRGLSLDKYACALYTTMEPCPQCLGAIYMSGIREFHYACRDAWAGSANLLGTTPYLSRKKMKVFAPQDEALEGLICALHADFVLRRGLEHNRELIELWRIDSPRGIRLAGELQRSGFYERVSRENWPVEQAIDWLAGCL